VRVGCFDEAETTDTHILLSATSDLDCCCFEPMNDRRFLTRSLQAQPWGERAVRVLAAALAAADPAVAVRRYLQREGETLFIDQRRYDLRDFDRILLVCIGKAGLAMATAAAEVLQERLTDGIVVVKEAPESGVRGLPVRVIVSGHPVPDDRSLFAGEAIAGLLTQLGSRDLVLMLVSGGGSALVTLPVEGITLDEVQGLTRSMLAAGATINELNCLRKHLDRIKGGGIAQMAATATLATLILSDVVGSPLDTIASGPTTPDPSTFLDASALLDRYGLNKKLTSTIRGYLLAGALGRIPETPKPGDPIFRRVQNVLIGSNERSAAAAMAAAQAEGFHTLLLSTFVEGEARTVGTMCAGVLREIAHSANPVARPACLIMGGETTVTLRGKGYGGRNQELALAALPYLDGLRDVALVSLATDGGDGPTDAAGAVVTGESAGRARDLGLNTIAALANNDSYAIFETLEDLLRVGIAILTEL
jgi:glycerate 2-kinase